MRAALFFSTTFTAALITGALPVPAAFAGPVEDAYKAIPHHQTTYSAAQSKLISTKAQAIESLLALSDLALVERIEAAGWLISGGKHGRNFSDYENHLKNITADIGKIDATEEIESAKNLILAAIEAQRDFLVEQFKLAYESKNYRWPAGYRDDARIQLAHQKLLEAYKILDTTFPDESDNNKKAFFDHLCALDYL